MWFGARLAVILIVGSLSCLGGPGDAQGAVDLEPFDGFGLAGEVPRGWLAQSVPIPGGRPAVLFTADPTDPLSTVLMVSLQPFDETHREALLLERFVSGMRTQAHAVVEVDRERLPSGALSVTLDADTRDGLLLTHVYLHVDEDLGVTVHTSLGGVPSALEELGGSALLQTITLSFLGGALPAARQDFAQLFDEMLELTATARYDEALERAAALVEHGEALGSHRIVARFLADSGRIHRLRGDLRAAEKSLLRARDRAELQVPREGELDAQILEGLGRVQLEAGKLGEAETSFDAAERKLAGLGSNLTTLRLAADRAELWRCRGQLVRAREGLDEAIALTETMGAEASMLATLHGNLGAVLVERGEWEQAEQTLLFASSLLESSGSRDPTSHVGITVNLAEVRAGKGDLAGAEALLDEVRGVLVQVLGPDHFLLGSVLNNLAKIRVEYDDLAGAAELLEESIRIVETSRGADFPALSNSYTNLGEVLRRSGELAPAREAFEHAREILAAGADPADLRLAFVANNLALLALDEGDIDRAEMELRRAIDGFDGAGLAEHPSLAVALGNLGHVRLMDGDVEEAVALRSRGFEIEETHVRRLAASGLNAERELDRYLQTLDESTHSTVALHQLHAPEDPRAAELALTCVLQRKGRVLDTLTLRRRALQRRMDPASRARADELAGLHAELAREVLDGGTDRDRLATLDARIGALEAEQADRSAGAEPALDLLAVRAALPDGTALVELFVYIPFDIDGWPERPWAEPRLAAYVISREGPVHSRDLGPIGEIEDSVRRWLLLLGQGPGGRSYDALDAEARSLDQRLLEPLDPWLTGCSRILVSPDGLLNLFPFDALVAPDGRHRIHHASIGFLGSGGDLLRTDRSGAHRSPPLVLSNPDFDDLDGPPGEGIPGAASSPPPLTGSTWAPLPATAAEGDQVTRLLPGAELLTGPQATKAALLACRGPAILHVATHGFFLTETLEGPNGGRGAKVARPLDSGRLPPPPQLAGRPLLSSGLVLAGANRPDDGSHRGILTALELADADLEGTQLAVLSACETGLGELRDGQGVYGLRRALALAGVQTQVISLWKVDDEGTKELMIRYYERLAEGQDRLTALRDARLDLLADPRWSHPRYWAAFVISGGWGPVDLD